MISLSYETTWIYGSSEIISCSIDFCYGKRFVSLTSSILPAIILNSHAVFHHTDGRMIGYIVKHGKLSSKIEISGFNIKLQFVYT